MRKKINHFRTMLVKYNFVGDNMTMKLRIRDLREDNDLSQEKVSKYLMCDQSLYSKYERGEREIPLKLVVELARFYNVSIDYIVGLTDEPSPLSVKR